MHYALGCNGNGVALMSYLGHRIGKHMAGVEQDVGAFGEGTFPLSVAGMASTLAVPASSALYRIGDMWHGRVRKRSLEANTSRFNQEDESLKGSTMIELNNVSKW